MKNVKLKSKSPGNPAGEVAGSAGAGVCPWVSRHAGAAKHSVVIGGIGRAGGSCARTGGLRYG